MAGIIVKPHPNTTISELRPRSCAAAGRHDGTILVEHQFNRLGISPSRERCTKLQPSLATVGERSVHLRRQWVDRLGVDAWNVIAPCVFEHCSDLLDR
jgi:hypothetical protein